MKYSSYEVINLLVFDNEGKLVTKLDSLKQSYIDRDQVFVKDALLNVDLLSFIGKEEETKISDFDKFLSGHKTSKTILLGGIKEKECKLIGEGFIRNQHSGKDIGIKFEIPKASIQNKYVFESRVHTSSDHDLYFNVLPFNVEGDTIKIHIEE